MRGLQLNPYGGSRAPVSLLLLRLPPVRRCWTPQIEGSSSRPPKFVPDLSGFVVSLKPSTREYSPRKQRSTSLASTPALLDHLEINRAVVAGLSMGGYAALALARPRLSGCAVWCWPTPVREPTARRGGRGGSTSRGGCRRRGPASSAETLPAAAGPDHPSRGAEVVARVERMIRDAPPAGGRGLAQRAWRGGRNRTAVLERITVPVLVVVGEEDELTPPEESRNLGSGGSRGRDGDDPGSRLPVEPGASDTFSGGARRAPPPSVLGMRPTRPAGGGGRKGCGGFEGFWLWPPGRRPSSAHDVTRLQPHGTLNDFEVHLLALVQRPEPFGTMAVWWTKTSLSPSLGLDEPITLRIVEPLHRSSSGACAATFLCSLCVCPPTHTLTCVSLLLSSNARVSSFEPRSKQNERNREVAPRSSCKAVEASQGTSSIGVGKYCHQRVGNASVR